MDPIGKILLSAGDSKSLKREAMLTGPKGYGTAIPWIYWFWSKDSAKPWESASIQNWSFIQACVKNSTQGDLQKRYNRENRMCAALYLARTIP